MSPQPSYHDWPTKSEAALALGCSVRQVERMIEAGTIHSGFRPVPHRRAACVCDPDDVAKVAGERRAAAQSTLVVGHAPMIAPTVLSDHPARLLYDLARLVSDGAAATAAASNPQAIPLSQKAYLTLDQAIEYSGLPKSELLRQMKMGLLETVKAGRWYIRRKSLDAL